MIEVEKKFLLREDDIERLIKGADFLNEVVNEDTYYDNADNVFLTSGSWLRNRNGKFEMKIPMYKPGQNDPGGVECYKELTSDKDIAAEIGINLSNKLEEVLSESGYEPFAKIITNRKKYKKEGFNIDIDQTNFGHNVVEIELGVENEVDIKDAKEKIVNFAKDVGLSMEKMHGKMTHYLKKHSPDKYEVLRSFLQKSSTI